MLHYFVLTSFVVYTVMPLKPNTWKEIPRLVREQSKQAERMANRRSLAELMAELRRQADRTIEELEVPTGE